MELIVLSQIMISLLILALVSTRRLYQRRSLASLSTEQPLIFSVYMTFLAAVGFCIWSVFFAAVYKFYLRFRSYRLRGSFFNTY
jgi:hypothetical protein